MDPEPQLLRPELARRLVRYSPWAFGILIALLAGIQAPRADNRAVLLEFALLILILGLAALLLVRMSGGGVTVPRGQRYLVMAFAISASISASASPSPIDSLPRATTYVALAVLAMAVYGVARRESWTLAPWLWAIVVASGLFVTVALIDMAPHAPDSQWSHVGLFVNVRRMAAVAFLVACAFGGIGLLATRLRFVTLLGSTFMLVVIMASGSRGPLLAWVAFLGTIAILRGKSDRGSFIRDGFLTCVVAAGAVLVLHVTGIWETRNVFVRAAEVAAAEGDGFGSGRIELWRRTLNAVVAQPWFGYGPDAFAIVEPDAPVVHPHNVLLQALMEFGLVGCLVLLAWSAHALASFGAARVLRACRETTEGQVLTATLAAQAALAMIDGPLYWMPAIAQFAVCAGLWCSVVAKREAADS